MGSVKDRLLELVDKIEGGNAAKFAKKAGIAQSTFHNYLQGQSLKSDNIIRITERFGVNLNWLLAGEGGMFKAEELKSPKETYGHEESKPDQENSLPNQPDDLVTEISFILGKADVPKPKFRAALQSLYSLVMAERSKQNRAAEKGNKLTLSGNGNVQAVGSGNKIKK